MPSDKLLMPGYTAWFTEHWWAILLRGALAIAFAIVAFMWPVVTLGSLVLLFGFYALLDGIFSLLTAIGGRRGREDRWLLALEGIVGIWAGVIALRVPVITAVVFVFFMSLWAMATGFLRIVTAIKLRKEISGEVWLILSGLASVFFALLLMFRPGIGAIALVWILGGYALTLGILLVMLGIELHQPHIA
jgi:uncharacterized membrane protein HdeD (DUF308 family)